MIVLHHSSGVKSPYETNKYYIAAFYNMGTSEKDVWKSSTRTCQPKSVKWDHINMKSSKNQCASMCRFHWLIKSSANKVMDTLQDIKKTIDITKTHTSPFLTNKKRVSWQGGKIPEK